MATNDHVLVRVAGRGPRDVYHELAADNTAALCGRVQNLDDWDLYPRALADQRCYRRCAFCRDAQRRVWG